jgi:chromatin segregation and condensation protein Rec8/ScpA/Scc1 (kleisin family)
MARRLGNSAVKEKIQRILELLRRTESVTFLSPLEGDFSMLNLAATFSAVLELAKLQMATVYQDMPLAPFLFRRGSPLAAMLTRNRRTTTLTYARTVETRGRN